MQIETPQNVRAWIKGFFSGSFRGNLDGIAAYAETASYVENVPDLSGKYLPVSGGTLSGELCISSSTEKGLKVLGSTNLGGDTFVSGNLIQTGDEISMARGKIKLIRSPMGNLEFRIKK